MSRGAQLALDASNSRVYRARPRPKHALIRWERAEYVLAGGPQRFDGPHVCVFDAGGDYGVAFEVFFATHAPLHDRPHYYIKVVMVRARRAEEAFELVTMIDGREEARVSVTADMYVVQNPRGELYAMIAEEFELRYELSE